MTVSAKDVRLRRDIFKSSIAPIVVKNVFRPRKPSRSAHHRNTLPEARRPVSGRRRGRKIEIHIVGYDQVDAAIAVVVHKRATGPPILARSSDAALFRDFLEYAVIVMVKAILAVIRDVEIFPSVVIVITED